MIHTVLKFIQKTCVPISIAGMIFFIVFLTPTTTGAVEGVNEQLNFQGRLYNSQGATVPDGFYNIEFKIYQDGDGQTENNTTGSPAGSLKWTENYLNSDGNGVKVKNGFMSVNLGSIVSFGTNIDWNQDTLWLSLNIAGTNASCTPFASCSPDGEMLPMKRLSATPYALNTNRLNGLESTQFIQLAQGVQTDASTSTSSIHINKTGTGNLITLQSNGTDSFVVNNSGDMLFGNNANHAISVTTADATVAGRSLSISGGNAGAGASALAGGDLTLQGGNGGGTDGNGGNLNLDSGIKTGSGTNGSINIGTSNASTIQIGSTTLASDIQTINLGNNNTTGSTTNIIIGAGGGATAGTTTVQAKENLTFSTDGTTRGVFDISNNLFLGNGITSTTPSNFTISSTGSSTTGVTGGSLSIQGGNATTGNANGGDLILDAGTKAGTGTNGIISIGTSSATTIQIGSTTLSTGTQTVNVGNNNTTGGTTDVTIGAGGSASGGTTTVQAKGNITFNTDGTARAIIDTSNSLYLGNGITATTPSNFTVRGTGSTTTGVAGGSLNMQGGNATAGNANGGSISINAGTKTGTGSDGNVNIGNTSGSTIQIGNSALSTGTQTINIGNSNTAGGTTNITIGTGSSATGGNTTIQSKTNTVITAGGTLNASSTGDASLNSSGGTLSLSGNGNTSLTSSAGTISLNSNGNTTISTSTITRATFDTSNTLYLGNGVTVAAPTSFTISGTNSNTTGVSGGNISVQGGNATTGDSNGGNLILSGGSGSGTGSNGLVVLNSPTFSTTMNDTNCYTGGSLVASDCTVSVESVNNYGAILVGFSTTNKTATLPDPTNTTAGQIIYLTAANNSQDFTIYVNDGGVGNLISMRQNTTATMIWNGNDWTAAGASSSTTLQSAYDNTMQSAGGAELVVSKTSTTNGFTIRDSSVNSVNGTLLAVQNSSSAGLFSVNSNVTEYSTNSGAETIGALSSTFPTDTWNSNGSATTVRYTTAGSYIATGQASVSTTTSTNAQDGVKNRLSTALNSNMHYNVSFSARLASGTFTDMNVYYSVDGTTASIECTASEAIITSTWTKINCEFGAPESGITADNSILIRQTSGGTARTFYIDNLSVTIAADYNYATDGGVYDFTNFNTNWNFANATTGVGTVTRNTSDGYDASDSATVNITTGAANAGIRNKLSISPLTDTLYRISTYAKLSSGTFTDFKIRYSRDGSTSSAGNYVDCVDYNTQTISTSEWTKITCYLTTDSVAATDPYVYFVGEASTARSYHIDIFTMTLYSNTTPNVQIGSGITGGPTTLLTLDRSASAPVAVNNDALLGSMYYDTTLGKLQCYESDGWGACGSSPDNVVTISPEYTNAVMHGTGVGTMISDICSSTLNINDGTSGQPTVCGSNETYNFYKWTSPQASTQTYSIYITYQLPDTFKTFASGSTSVMGRTDSTNSTVQYQIYRSDLISGLTPCGTTNSISTGVQSEWQVKTASGASDPSTCGFSAGNSIVFKISMTASQNANAYVSNLNFTFSNK